MVQSTLLTLTALSQLSTGYTASKYIAEYRSIAPERAGRIMGLCSLVSIFMAIMGALLLIGIAPWISKSVLHVPHLSKAFLIGSIFLFFSAINGYQLGALSGLESYAILAKASVFSGIIAVVSVSLGALYGGVNGAILGLSISALIRCIIHNGSLRMEIQRQGIIPQYYGSFTAEKAIVLKFALPASIAGYYSIPMIWMGNYILVRQPSGYAEMAHFAAAMNVKSLLLFIPVVMNTVASSILNNVRGNRDSAQYSRIYNFNVVCVFLSVSVMAAFLGVWGKYVLEIFGKDFGAGKVVLVLLLISGVFEATTSSIYQRIQNSGRMWLSFLYINLPLGPLFVLLSYFLIPEYGAKGLGFANVCMVMLSFGGTIALVKYVNSHEQPAPIAVSTDVA